jgi:SAM-dependent methyltransferase
MGMALKSIHELGSKTDKSYLHQYLHAYEALFEPIRSNVDNVLEIGVYSGDSHLMWRDYFPNARIYGLDIVDNCGGLLGEDRITVAFRDAYTQETVSSFGDTKFDVIIDDGPHTLASLQFAVKEYSNLLTPNGILVVEDIFEVDWFKTLSESTPVELQPYTYGIDVRSVPRSPTTWTNHLMFVIDKRFIR